MMTKKMMNIENDVQWFELNGVDAGTGVTFKNETFGITTQNGLVDSESYPLECESDYRTIAVRNSL